MDTPETANVATNQNNWLVEEIPTRKGIQLHFHKMLQRHGKKEIQETTHEKRKRKKNPS